MKNTTIILSLLLILLIGCSTSHVIVGNRRAPTDPEQIKIYFSPPKHYETIAVVSADSNGSFQFSAQGKIDAALERAKRDAASLGANGLLLQTLGENGSVIVANGVSSGSNTSFVGVSAGGLIKTVSVLAIYVTEE
jgi:hypothetical protein